MHHTDMYNQDGPSLAMAMASAKRSSLFMSSSNLKRNLWWQAFRKTVLEPHSIAILDNPMADKVPYEVLQLVEEKCHGLERHEQQALTFVDAIAQGRGFGQSPIFPQSIIPKQQHSFLVRCLEAEYDNQTLPVQEDSFGAPVFDMPTPRPGLACGFSDEAFTSQELKEIPTTSTVVGTLIDQTDGHIQSNYAARSPFLLFERTYGHAKHEIEAAMNYCAMNGAAALNAMAKLYDSAWPEDVSRPIKTLVVFSCIIDNDLGIINHHWMSGGGYYVAPLCKFDFHDLEHFMHFLAWIEAIEDWAVSNILPDLRKALQVLVDRKEAGMGIQALPSPFSTAEKEEKLSQAMRLAFDNIPWKGERSRKTPLAVTGTMRMRSPKAQLEPEPIMTPMSLTHHIPPVPTQPPLAEAEIAAEQLSDPAPATTDSYTLDTDSPQLECLKSDAKSEVTGDGSVEPKVAGFVLPVTLPEAESAVKSKKSRLGLSLIKSAGLSRSVDSSKETRSISSAGLETNKSPAASIRTMPIMRPENGASPGIMTSTSGVRSPAQSMTSVTSKRSFSSLVRGRKVKSPNTPEFGNSPKENGFKSKIANSLDMIKEHTTPKRTYADNSAPSSAKGAPLPTPAYDKKRFDIKTPKPVLPPTPKSVPEDFMTMPIPLPISKAHGSPRPTASANIMSQETYDANHRLPLRQYAKSPTTAVTNTTTLTTFI